MHGETIGTQADYGSHADFRLKNSTRVVSCPSQETLKKSSFSFTVPVSARHPYYLNNDLNFGSSPLGRLLRSCRPQSGRYDRQAGVGWGCAGVMHIHSRAQRIHFTSYGYHLWEACSGVGWHLAEESTLLAPNVRGETKPSQTWRAWRRQSLQGVAYAAALGLIHCGRMHGWLTRTLHAATAVAAGHRFTASGHWAGTGGARATLPARRAGRLPGIWEHRRHESPPGRPSSPAISLQQCKPLLWMRFLPRPTERQKRDYST